MSFNVHGICKILVLICFMLDGILRPGAIQGVFRLVQVRFRVYSGLVSDGFGLVQFFQQLVLFFRVGLGMFGAYSGLVQDLCRVGLGFLQAWFKIYVGSIQGWSRFQFELVQGLFGFGLRFIWGGLSIYFGQVWGLFQVC